MRNKTRTNKPEDAGQSSLLGELTRMRGGAEGLDVTLLDPVMLWYAVVALTGSGASFQLGLTKDKASWSCQLWEGQYPVKDYFSDTAQLNKHLAALVRLGWKKGLPDDVEALVREYGW